MTGINEMEYGFTIRERFGNVFFLTLSVIIAIVPELNRNFPKIIWLAIILLWYVDIFLHHGSSYLNRCPDIVALLFGWIFYIGILRIVGYSSADFGNYFLVFAAFDLILKGIYAHNFYSEHTRKQILRLIQIIILICVVQNIYIGISEPDAFYYMYFFPERYVGRNVAITQFYEMLSFYIGINCYLFLSEDRGFFKFLEAVSVVLSLFFMVTFEPRTTALVITALLVLLILVNQGNNQQNRLLVGFFAIIVIMLIIVFFKESIINLLPERMAVRVRAVFDLSGSMRIGDSVYTRRFELQLNSLKTFVSSPKSFFIGSGWHLGDQYSNVVGQHALFTDYLAAYGCIGLVFILTFCKTIKKIIVKNLTIEKYYKALWPVFLICMFITNPFRPEVLPTSIFLMFIL